MVLRVVVSNEVIALGVGADVELYFYSGCLV